MNLDNKKHLLLIGFFIGLLATIFYMVFIWDTKVGATYNPCRHNQCITPVPTAVPSVTLVPTVTVAPTVEPTITETPTAIPSPTNTPENKQNVSDGRSDGRSDGLCSKPPCVDNRSGVPLYKETINK